MKSTSTTTLNHTSYQTSYRFASEEVGLVAGNNIHMFQAHPKFNKKEKHVKDFISDQIKVFVYLGSSFYHFMHEDLGEFLAQYSLTPDALFIIDITGIVDRDPLPTYIQNFFKFLNKNNVDYVPVDLRVINKFNVNNLYFRDLNAESFEINNPWPKIHEMSKQFVTTNIDVTDGKKVYLTRKNYKGRSLKTLIKGRLPYENDDRMDDENKVEEYFISLGFDIVAPDEFKTFESQISYFSKAKMVASTTSSGLVNAAFMPTGSAVLELTTPLIAFTKVGNGVTEPPSVGTEEIHHFYHLMAARLGHRYVSIPNLNRSSEEVINTIENDTFLKAWLSA
jgi:hypothetical protein